MKNLNVLEKSRGAVLFAFNTTTIDYIKIAVQSAQLIDNFLNLPVTLITDADVKHEIFDQIIRVNHVVKNSKNCDQTEWRNADRYTAYDLSPYNETLLLDSDYLIFDCSLLTLFEVTSDFRLQHNNHMIGEESNFVMGMTSLPYIWATVVLFKKTLRSKQFFDLVGRIQRNYEYYKLLYNIRERNFRNDYAFTIANSILNGYELGQDQSNPWNMVSFHQLIKKIEIKNNNLIVKLPDKAYVLPMQNVHIMDKQYLLSNEFDQLVEQVCQKKNNKVF